MKMSDVFDLPFTADAEFQSIFDASGEPLPDFESVEKDKAVVQAINSHDALVELNKELIDALESCILDMCISCEGPVNGTAVKGDAVLAKAKELLKEKKQ